MADAKVAKFVVGAAVNYAAADDNSFPAGIGTVESVKPDGKKFVYSVKSADGTVLTAEFDEADLSAV